MRRHMLSAAQRCWRAPALPKACVRCLCQPTVNKQPTDTSADPRLYEYMMAHTREPQVLAELREETAGLRGAGMQITPEQGQFLALLARLMGCTRYLEVGVFTGYSSTAVALALPPDGQVVALDRDAATMEIAQRYWRKAGVADKVESRLGSASDTLQQLLEERGQHSFDFAFVDADKRQYRSYYETLLQLVRPGGLIAIDNVLWYGKVADPEATDKATMALRELNAFLKSDERVDHSIVPIGDGVALCRVR